jgi:hypothetical protein
MEEAEIGRLMSESGLKPTMQSDRRMSRFIPESGRQNHAPACLTWATWRHRPPLFNDLVGAAQQGKWHGEAKCLCRLHVDYEFELCDLLHR